MEQCEERRVYVAKAVRVMMVDVEETTESSEPAFRLLPAANSGPRVVCIEDETPSSVMISVSHQNQKYQSSIIL